MTNWTTFFGSFGATLLGTPMLLTVTATASFGPANLLFSLLGVATATIPLYLLGVAIRCFGLRLPARIEQMANNVVTPAIAAAVTPSFALYWIVSAVAGIRFEKAALASAMVSLPIALIFGLTTIAGHQVGIPTPIISLTTLTLFMILRTLHNKYRKMEIS